MNGTTTESKAQKDIEEAQKARAEEIRKDHEARAEELRKKKEARAEEIKKNQPKEGEAGYYSPPIRDAVTARQPQVEMPVEDPPPGMSPEEQPISSPIVDAESESGKTKSTGSGKTASDTKSTGSTNADEQEDYDSMTVAELKDLAHKRGVEIHSDMLKDDIIKALKKSDKAG